MQQDRTMREAQGDMRGALARAHRLVEASEGITGPAGREVRMASAAVAAPPPARARMGQGYYGPLVSMIAGEVPKVEWKSKEAYEAFESEILARPPPSWVPR